MANNGSVIIGIDGDDSGLKSTLKGIGSTATKTVAAVSGVATAVQAAGKAVASLGVKYNAEIEPALSEQTVTFIFRK